MGTITSRACLGPVGAYRGLLGAVGALPGCPGSFGEASRKYWMQQPLFKLVRPRSYPNPIIVGGMEKKNDNSSHDYSKNYNVTSKNNNNSNNKKHNDSNHNQNANNNVSNNAGIVISCILTVLVATAMIGMTIMITHEHHRNVSLCQPRCG